MLTKAVFIFDRKYSNVMAKLTVCDGKAEFLVFSVTWSSIYIHLWIINYFITNEEERPNYYPIIWLFFFSRSFKAAELTVHLQLRQSSAAALGANMIFTLPLSLHPCMCSFHLIKADRNVRVSFSINCHIFFYTFKRSLL